MVNKKNAIDTELIDTLIKDCKDSGDIFGQEGLFKSLQKQILERMLESELSHDLGYSKHDSKGRNSGNSRNGYSVKTLKGEQGDLHVQIPRDRNGSFEPQIIPKH